MVRNDLIKNFPQQKMQVMIAIFNVPLIDNSWGSSAFLKLYFDRDHMWNQNSYHDSN